jgi:hypothetical protein
MKIPSKSKIFLWRALHGILPLKCILANPHVGTEGGCPICNSGLEDVLHLLFKCPVAMELWALLGLSEVIQEGIQTDLSGSAVLEFFLTRQDIPFHDFEFGLKEVIGFHAGTCGGLEGDERMVKMSLRLPIANYQFFIWLQTLLRLRRQKMWNRKNGHHMSLDS